MRTYKDAKAMAKSLRESLAARNVSLTHGECLEIVARQFGFTQWNTLSAKLDVEAGRLIRPEVSGISLEPAIPVLQVTSLEKAAPFYADFLGFQLDWGFPKGNTYAQISRSGLTIHLNVSSHLHRNAEALIRMRGLDSLHRELSGKLGPFAPTEIMFTPWDSRVFHLTDPFGNALRFWENNPPGVAAPIQSQVR